MKFAKNLLIVTNPLAIPIEVGILLAVIVKNLFGGVYKDCKKIAKATI